MEIIVPGWAVMLFGTVFLPWLLWLTVKTFDNQKSIEINTANDRHVGGELARLNASIERVDKKIDNFLATELTVFKSIIKELEK